MCVREGCVCVCVSEGGDMEAEVLLKGYCPMSTLEG